MNTPIGAGAGLPASSSAPTLLELVRNPRLYPILRALLRLEVSRLNFTGALKHFTFPAFGDELLASDEDLQTISRAIGKATANPKLRLSTAVLPVTRGQTTLRLSPKAERALLLELLALTANLSVHDLSKLPPPVDLVGDKATDQKGG